MNKADLENLAEMRLREAKTLLDAEHYSGAYYLCGYVIECALKACIAKQTRQYDFPDKTRVADSWTHDLRKLLDIANLKAEMRADKQMEARWGVVAQWSETSRYTVNKPEDAELLYTAVSDATGGVLQWIQKYW